jgi:hypothetical protein
MKKRSKLLSWSIPKGLPRKLPFRKLRAMDEEDIKRISTQKGTSRIILVSCVTIWSKTTFWHRMRKYRKPLNAKQRRLLTRKAKKGDFTYFKDNPDVMFRLAVEKQAQLIT